ncbi:hypothetical protein D3C87_1939220 [compost metagenome]
MLAARVKLRQVALRQTMETQQQMIVILLQIRLGRGHQRVEIFRLIVERLAH